MPWFRLDESFHSHPKVQRAGNAATGLWVRCGTWSAQYLTDGVIPPDVYTLYGRTREIDQLVAAHLWTPVTEGMLMPDYLDYNPSKADIEQRRKRDAERKRRGHDGVDHASDGRWFNPDTDEFR